MLNRSPAVLVVLLASVAHAQGDVVEGGSAAALGATRLDVTLPSGESWSVGTAARPRRAASPTVDVVTRRTSGRAPLAVEVRRIAAVCGAWAGTDGPTDLATAYAVRGDAPFWPRGEAVYVRSDGTSAVGCIDTRDAQALEFTFSTGAPADADAPVARALVEAIVAGAGGSTAMNTAAVAEELGGGEVVDGVLRLPLSGLEVRVPTPPANTRWVAADFDTHDVIRWVVTDPTRIDAASAAAAAPLSVQVQVAADSESCALHRAEAESRNGATTAPNPYAGGPWQSKIWVTERPNADGVRFHTFCLETAAGSRKVDFKHTGTPDPALFGPLIHAIGEALLAKDGALPPAPTVTLQRVKFTLPGPNWRVSQVSNGVLAVPTGVDDLPVAFTFTDGPLALLCGQADKLNKDGQNKGAAWLGEGWTPLTVTTTEDDRLDLRSACLPGRRWILAAVGSPRPRGLQLAEEKAVAAVLTHVGAQVPPALSQVALGLEAGPMSPSGMDAQSGTSVLVVTRVLKLADRGFGAAVSTRSAFGYGGGGLAYDLSGAGGVSFGAGPVQVGALVGGGIDNIGVLTSADSHIGLGAFVMAQGILRVTFGAYAVTASYALCPRTGPDQTRIDLGATMKKRPRATGWRLGVQVIDYESTGTYVGGSVSVDLGG